MSWFDNPARTFFSETEDQEIVEAIRKAELHTSGEIRVHVENRFFGKNILRRAAKIFRKLNMHKTDLRNGVLIYFALKNHKFAIIADQGINEKVPTDFFTGITGDLSNQFKEKKFKEGLVTAILAIGEQLSTWFPREEDDKNELPDDISYS
ncbi:MAG: TPM domain-containing protein [Bacteroidota bacterium]